MIVITIQEKSQRLNSQGIQTNILQKIQPFLLFQPIFQKPRIEWPTSQRKRRIAQMFQGPGGDDQMEAIFRLALGCVWLLFVAFGFGSFWFLLLQFIVVTATRPASIHQFW